MSETTERPRQVASTDRSHARPWAWVSLGAAVAAASAMFALPRAPVLSLGLAVLSLVCAWRARGVREVRVVVTLASVLALAVLGLHLTAGLAWSGATGSG